MSSTEQLTDSACFPASEIRSALLGYRRGTMADILAQHVSNCPQCAAVAEAFFLDSTVISGLRPGNQPFPPSDSEFNEVVTRVSQIARASWAGQTVPALPEIALPLQLGPYELVERLGAGGMGVVYKAKDTALQRDVAVKVVRGVASADASHRFLKEARALAAVRHDNVVTVYFVGEKPTEDGTMMYLAMELLEGQTLRQWMETATRPSIAWVVQIGQQITAGLAFVHDAGMVHRDIKPANLWLETPRVWIPASRDLQLPPSAIGRVKLLDFGLAHQLDPSIKMGAAGTPAYAAPEQSRGELVDARADLYSLGCVLYELCAGCLPFPAKNRLWADQGPTFASVRALNPMVPERLANLIERLLAHDPADRPQSAHAVELELASIESQLKTSKTAQKQNAAVTSSEPSRQSLHRFTIVLLVVTALGALIMSIRSHLRPHPAEFAPQTPAVTTAQESSAASAQQILAPNGEIDSAWRNTLSSQAPQRQLNEVLQAMGKLNPKFDWLMGSGWVEPYGVIRVTVDGDTITDLRPIQVLKTLTVLRCRGSAPGMGIVTDLSPLAELKLKELHCRNNPALWDLSPVCLDNLDFLDASFTSVETLSGLARAPVVQLKVAGTLITDLGPVRKMTKLKLLDCTGCQISDFEPLTGTPIRELRAEIDLHRDSAVLKRITTLEFINQLPVKTFWEYLEANDPEHPTISSGDM